MESGDLQISDLPLSGLALARQTNPAAYEVGPPDCPRFPPTYNLHEYASKNTSEPSSHICRSLERARTWSERRAKLS